MRLNYNSKMEIKKDFKNSLFKRQEITGELESEKNPSFDEVKKFIAEKLKKPEETIEVRNVKGGFGNHVFHVEAHIYDSKENLDTMKELTRTKKQRTEDAKPAEEKPAEETPAPTETPVEEAKPAEETKEEPKPAEEAEEEAPVEDKPEEQAKEVKEEKQKAEEAKE